MKSLKLLLLGVSLTGVAAAAAAELSSFHAVTTSPPTTPPALYSFADVYRLTVAGAMGGLPQIESASDATIRVAIAQSAGAEPRFSITAVPQPDKWLLLLAGLALAGWVAHRRLVHSL